MLVRLAIILLVVWLFGIATGVAMGRFLYVLPVMAITLLLLQAASWRRIY